MNQFFSSAIFHQMNSKYRSGTVLTIMIVFLLAACSEKKTVQQTTVAPVLVTVTTVKDTAAIYHDEYPATLSALNEVKLTAQVNGYITGVYFKDGAKVSKGQRLYSIDQQVYGANLQQAIAGQQVQETNLLKAQRDAERYHELDKLLKNKLLLLKQT
jgi:membrane fusion protein (multidrug efflux system)